MATQAIINFTKEKAALKARGEEAPAVGRGIGMAIGLFCLIVFTSIMQHQVCAQPWPRDASLISSVLLALYVYGYSIKNRPHKLDISARS